MDTKRFQILALSGGGFRGLYTARILDALEQKAGTPLANCFGLLAGTSIGGIIALAIALEKPTADIVRMFELHGGDIFRRRNTFGMWQSPYTTDAMRELLGDDAWFGTRTLQELKHPTIIPVLDYSNGAPVVFATPHDPLDMRGANTRLVDVALATSAAPAYFPRFVLNNREYLDGGLFANAPGAIALNEADFHMSCEERDMYILAIGTTGTTQRTTQTRNGRGGMLDWGGFNPLRAPRHLLELSISAQEIVADSILRHRLTEERYVMLDDVLSDDDASKVALDKIDADAREVLNTLGHARAQIALQDPRVLTMLSHRAAAVNIAQ